MVKRIFLDTETTGLSSKLNTIWQLGGVIESGEQEEYFEYLCNPLGSKKVDAAALEVGGVTAELLSTYPTSIQMFGNFRRLLSKYVDQYNKYDKFMMYGYNVKFDADFLRQWFEDLGDKYFGSWFYVPYMDVMVLAAEFLLEERAKLKDFKLGTVAAYLGIKLSADELHSARYDAEITRAIYRRLKTERRQVCESKGLSTAAVQELHERLNEENKKGSADVTT